MLSHHSDQIPQVEVSNDGDLEALQFTQTQTNHLRQTALETKASYAFKESHDKILSMGRGRAFPSPLLNLDDYIVDFDGPDDPDHPYNWKFSVKYAGFSPSQFYMLICFWPFQIISFDTCMLWHICFFVGECDVCSRNQWCGPGIQRQS